MAFLQAPEFLIGLLKIVWINDILSGDKAVVIALAARRARQHAGAGAGLGLGAGCKNAAPQSQTKPAW